MTKGSGLDLSRHQSQPESVTKVDQESWLPSRCCPLDKSQSEPHKGPQTKLFAYQLRHQTFKTELETALENCNLNQARVTELLLSSPFPQCRVLGFGISYGFPLSKFVPEVAEEINYNPDSSLSMIILKMILLKASPKNTTVSRNQYCFE